MRPEVSESERLAELRSIGLTPYSRLATACGGALCLLLGSGIVVSEVSQIFALLVERSDVTLSEFLAAVLPHFEKALLLPVVLLLIGSLAVGLLQTRFLLRMGNVTPRLGRRSPKSPSAPAMSILRVCGALPAALVIVGAGCLPFVLLARDLLSPLANQATFLAFWGSKLGAALLAILCIALTVIGIMAWVGSRFVFLRRYKAGLPEQGSHD